MEWEECFDEDNPAPAAVVKDATGKLVFAVDARDHGWDRCGLGGSVKTHQEAVKDLVTLIAYTVALEVNGK